MKRTTRDILRVLSMTIIATILVVFSTNFAQAVAEPAFAPWGLFTGLAFYGVALSHVLRRLLFPYIDLRLFAASASGSPTGSGLVFMGVCIVLTAFITLMGSVVRAESLPANAVKYLPILKSEQSTWWAGMPAPATLAAQVEQETCVSLRSSRCWSPRAELRTSRERGVGLGQITKTDRFDALREIRAANPSALRDWSWNQNLYDPHYQLRGLVLKDLQGYKALPAATDADRLAFAFAAYNGGIGGVLSDQRTCRATVGCNAGRWFGNVEHASLKMKKPVSGYGKSFFQINREYVRNVLIVRRPKYDKEFT